MPFISIIIPVYNAEHFINNTIDSILKQDFTDFEILLVDDGSTDNTRQVIEPYLTEKIHYFYQENSGGPAEPRNFGVKHSSGDIITLFDSDDVMLRNKLSRTAKFFCENPEISFLFNNFTSIDEKGNLLNESFLDQYSLLKNLVLDNPSAEYQLIDSNQAYRQLANSNYIGTSGVSFRKEITESVGYFDASLKNGDDRDMWFRIAMLYDLAYMPEVLHCYRVRQGSISSRGTTGNCLNRIAVLNRQLSISQDPRCLVSLRNNISKNYFSAAYEQFWEAGNKKQAFFYVKKGLSHRVTIQLLKLFLVIILGKNFSSSFKNLISKINKKTQ